MGVIRAVIFDCDGVLVDSELISNTVLAELLSAAGLPTTLEDCLRDYRGRSMESVVALAAERHGAPLPPDIAERYYADAKARFAEEVEPIPGVIAALDRIELPTCVASSGPQHKMRGHAATHRPVDALRGPDLQRDRGPRTASPRPTCSCTPPARWASTRRARPSSRTASRASRRRAPLGCARSPSRATRDAGELAAAGGDLFHDMAELPELLAAQR